MKEEKEIKEEKLLAEAQRRKGGKEAELASDGSKPSDASQRGHWENLLTRLHLFTFHFSPLPLIPAKLSWRLTVPNRLTPGREDFWKIIRSG